MEKKIIGLAKFFVTLVCVKSESQAQQVAECLTDLGFEAKAIGKEVKMFEFDFEKGKIFAKEFIDANNIEVISWEDANNCVRVENPLDL